MIKILKFISDQCKALSWSYYFIELNFKQKSVKNQSKIGCLFYVWFSCDLLQNLARLLYGESYKKRSEF